MVLLPDLVISTPRPDVRQETKSSHQQTPDKKSIAYFIIFAYFCKRLLMETAMRLGLTRAHMDERARWRAQEHFLRSRIEARDRTIRAIAWIIVGVILMTAVTELAGL
ncbi:MAG: hypothetical protein AAF918_16105 [Pseudomonadota bacterium]